MDILSNRRKRRAEVNIVPLVDVLTVLIFFFLLTMQFKNIYAVDITPPKMESAAARSESTPATVSITKNGKYFYDNKEVSLEQLKKKIDELGKAENPSLILLADEGAMLKYATNVIDIVKLSKVRKLSLQTLGAE